MSSSKQPAATAQKKPRQKRATQRSMTFSGCFTCRSRGVKCDEQRPACQRCVKARRECAGYGVRLIWAEQQENRQENRQQNRQQNRQDQKQPSRSQRRSLPWAYSCQDGSAADTPALGDDELDVIIAALPSEQDAVRTHPHAKLFGTFAAETPPEQQMQQQQQQQQQQLVLTRRASAPCISSPVLQACLDDLDDLDDLDMLNSICEMFLDPMSSPSPYTAPVTRICPSPQLARESQLLDYWFAHTSNLMVAIPRADNPFRTIFVPMALVAQSQLVPSAEHTALLHSICAIAALNRAQQQSMESREAYSKLGMNHHQLSISHLQRSLAAGVALDPEVVLATIILLISTNCVTGQSTSWRAHIHLGRQWLLSTASSRWHTRPTASTLYQIFLVLEALGASSDLLSLTGSLTGSAHRTATIASQAAGDYTYSSIFGLSCPALSYNYHLDSLFGITQPMFEAIVHMNQLSARQDPPSQQELDNLRAKIMLNDPRSLRTSTLAVASETERRFIHHHAYVYYFACRIHYERTLFHAAPHTIQHLVRNALGHLDAIANLETNNMSVMGLTWPVIVIACEVEDPVLQQRISWYFEQGQKYGVWNLSSAYQVLLEIWQQRSSQPRDCRGAISWQKVMTELGMDLLLA